MSSKARYRKNKKAYKALVVKTVRPKVTLSDKVNAILGRKMETKYHTNLVAVRTFGCSDPVGNRIFCTDITDVAQTAGASNDTTRIGDQITLSKIKVKFQILQLPLAAVTVGQTVRVIMFQWKPDSTTVTFQDPYPTLAEVATILQPGPSAAGTQDYNSMSHHAHDTRKLYRILYDSSFPMIEGGVSDNGIRSRSFDLNLKKAVKQINYNGGLTTGMNHIFFMCVGLAPTLENNVTADIRIFFKDS